MNGNGVREPREEHIQRLYHLGSRWKKEGEGELKGRPTKQQTPRAPPSFLKMKRRIKPVFFTLHHQGIQSEKTKGAWERDIEKKRSPANFPISFQKSGGQKVQRHEEEEKG